MRRGEVRRGRAGQAFDFGEPGVLDGATAKSLAAGRHGPRQVGQMVKTKPLRRSCLLILDQSLEPREPALPATGRSSSPVRSPGSLKGGLDIPSTHARCNSLRGGPPAPDARAPRSVTHWVVRDQDRSVCLSSDSCLL